MKKVLIVGAFGFDGEYNDGQTVKTRELYYGLCEKIGSENIDYIETIGWKKNPIKLLLSFFNKAKCSESIIMLPAQNGIYVFSRLLLFAKRLFKNRIYYDVIGGWVGNLLEKQKRLKKCLISFDSIWVETSVLKKQLLNLGFNNIEIIRNFKNLQIVNLDDKKPIDKDCLKLCIFSRINYMKGISDAINVVALINNEKDQEVKLDIYGPIADEYENDFRNLLEEHNTQINYKGVVSPLSSVDILKDYDALLFPTKYKNEGLPGTIIDAYAAGVPVISARWDSFFDIVEEGKTGIGYTINDLKELKEAIIWAIKNRELLYRMKINCTKKAKEFLRETVVDELIEKGFFD